ncbi:hypothetical protein [Chitinimonas lacunae]|uniref:Lipoprotein n=1 Tax=Chitinimonas lacunae TaxID=1963018 RepID=A0ABV8ML74_9NEIS
MKLVFDILAAVFVLSMLIMFGCAEREQAPLERFPDSFVHKPPRPGYPGEFEVAKDSKLYLLVRQAIFNNPKGWVRQSTVNTPDYALVSEQMTVNIRGKFIEIVYTNEAGEPVVLSRKMKRRSREIREEIQRIGRAHYPSW